MFTRTNGRYLLLGASASVRLVLLLALAAAACSIPNLEAPECDKARDVVREFYSRHFGNNADFSAESLGQRREYFTPRFYEELRAGSSPIDPFTLTDDPPKAFRAGECRVTEPGKRVSFDLLLFWRTDTRSEERSIRIEAENSEGRWLIDRVTN